jgi:hypothetical protein
MPETHQNRSLYNLAFVLELKLDNEAKDKTWITADEI